MESSKGREEVLIRDVWSYNLEKEFKLIDCKLKEGFLTASFDTEFPGTVYSETRNHASPTHVYSCLKRNVDVTNIIQLGLTLTNGQRQSIVWQFNFKDFNLDRGDFHNPSSIQLLKQQGIHFEKNNKDGIDSSDFASFFVKCGLNGNKNMTWIGFHSGYDFGYLVKVLTRLALPTELSGFMRVVRAFFGTRIYDIKHMMKSCDGLYGGLDKVAKSLGVERTAGKSHQAGSDSLLTMETYLKMKERFFGHMRSDDHVAQAYGGVLFGMEVAPPQIVQPITGAPVARRQMCVPIVYPQQRAPVVYRMMPLPNYVRLIS